MLGEAALDLEGGNPLPAHFEHVTHAALAPIEAFTVPRVAVTGTDPFPHEGPLRPLPVVPVRERRRGGTHPELARRVRRRDLSPVLRDELHLVRPEWPPARTRTDPPRFRGA